MNQPFVKNAADENQIDEAKGKLAISRNKEKNDWLFVMQSDQAFRVLQQVLQYCKVESCPMGAKNKETYYRIGRQDVGRFIKAQMVMADRRKYFEMELKLGEEN